MNVEEFRKHGKALIDFIADYSANIENIDVLPDVEPGFLSPLIPGKSFFS